MFLLTNQVAVCSMNTSNGRPSVCTIDTTPIKQVLPGSRGEHFSNCPFKHFVISLDSLKSVIDDILSCSVHFVNYDVCFHKKSLGRNW